MAQTPFSLLLLRRLTLSSQNPRPPLLPCLLKHFSTSQPFPSSSSSSEPPPKPSSLSARLSFVFDQIDAIEKQQHQILSQKDETLQRIRAWRRSRKPQTVSHSDPEPESSRLGSALDGNDKDAANSSPALEVAKDEDKRKKPAMEVVHPWPEWIEFIERLVEQNYFDHRRKDDDRLVQELGIDEAEVAAGGDDVRFDLTKDFRAVQTACINFGKDRFDILRSLSRQDIQILVGFGCPSAEKKVVFSAKLLRKRVHLDEGDVCSSCSLRNSCERAYLLTNKEDEARTIDVMRVLFTFGFDPLNGSVANEALLKQKSIKNVVRKLLHEVVKLSAVPIDPNLPPPVIKRPPPKVKQPPPPPKKRVGRDDIEMKKGDWLCPKCDFLNFAKNTVCLQCDAKRPKRQLLPGEWECPECNFLNYRRNMVCFHCECKRPQDEFMENKMQERQHGPRTRLEKIANRQEVSNAWNFDFDDNESDGADVAAFEHADPSMMAGDYLLDNQSHEGKFRGPEGSFNKVSRVPRVHEKEYSDGDTNRVGMGFDDFDDEEDDIDSYELETHHNSSGQKPSSKDFSEEEYSGMEDFEGTNDNMPARGRTYSPSYKPSKSMRVNAAFSGSEGDGLDLDSDEDLSVHPNWKSSHVADSRQGARGKGQGPSKRLSFGSDEEPGLYSDVDDDLDNNFKSRQSGNKLVYGKRDFGRKRSFYMKDDLFSGPELDDDENLSSRKQKKSQGRANHNSTRDTKYGSGGRMGSRRNSFSDDFDERGSQRSHGNNRGSHNTHRANYNSARDTKYGSSGRMGGRRNSFSDDFDERSQGSRGNNQGSYKNYRVGWQKRDRGADTRNSKAHGREDRFGKQQRGRLNEYDRDGDRDCGEFRNSRRVIER